MDPIVYIFLGLAILAVLILLFVAIKISGVVRNVNRNLEILPGLIHDLKVSAEKLGENLELSKESLGNLNHILSELKILPRIVEELGSSIKEFESFLKGQIEVVKDDLHYTLEESRDILKDVKALTTEVRDKTLKVTQNFDPLIKSLSETLDTGKHILDSFNIALKKTYVETSAIISGISELFCGIRKILRI